MSFTPYWALPQLGFADAPKTAADARRVASLGITHVLDLRAEAADQSGLYAPVGVTYLRLPFVDNGVQAPVSTYVAGVTFVRNALAAPGTRVLVHCAAGQYRSPSMVYAVLRSMGYSPDDAWSLVHRARPTANTQYRSGAERSVPSLPTGPTASVPEVESNTITYVLGLALAATVTYAAVWYSRHSSR